MTKPRKEQFSGSLIGQCLGDALGAPVEGQPHRVSRRCVDETLRTSRLDADDERFFSVGQYTDDSQLARELMQSYVACNGFNPEDYAGRIAAIFAEGRIFRPGGATSAAAARLIQGVAWDKAGTLAPSAGNGSAMRAGPIGLYYFDDPENLVRAARDQGRITHQDERCSAGAVAIAGAVALALRSDIVNVRDFVSQLAEWTAPIEPSVAAGIRRLIDWVLLRPGEAAAFISHFGLDQKIASGWSGISPFVTGSVLWSLYSFLRTPNDYWETICTAIAVGGDVDTTAAMAGAICGAHLGLEAIPRYLAQRLTDRGTWSFAELVDLADSAYEIKHRKTRGATYY
jgi:ADP-ribosylglycohydrolase